MPWRQKYTHPKVGARRQAAIVRLLGAVAQNPRFLGIGLDENTAIIVEKENRVRMD